MRTVVALVILACPLHVAAADPGGDLRVNVSCADYWATPGRGLTVAIDGVSYPALGENGYTGFELAEYEHVATPVWTWTPTDIGYAAAPGLHHVSIEAPGCAPLAEDVAIAPDQPALISGRLPIADEHLEGPTGAPNGFGIALGAFTRAQPAHGASNDLFTTSYAFDSTTVHGGSLAMSYERRALAFAWDLGFGTGPVSGTSTYKGDLTGESHMPVAFTGSEYATRFAARIGVRLPMHDVALSLGTGIGGDMIITDTTAATSITLAMPPSGLDADWYVPLWTQLTIKPACSWGAQVYASYDIHPTASAESAPMFGASLMFQPSSACSEATGLRVHAWGG